MLMAIVVMVVVVNVEIVLLGVVTVQVLIGCLAFAAGNQVLHEFV